MEQHLTTVLVLLIAFGVAAQWLAWRLKLPAIVLLIVAGLVAGPFTGWVDPSRDLGELLHPFLNLAVALILFEGGLNLRAHELEHSAKGVKRLVSAALPLSWVLGSLAAHFIGDLAWPTAILFGAITVVTGPTVIMPLLRQAGLARQPASLLKWEGIINDPVGALLAILVYEYFVFVGADTGFSQVISSLGLALITAAGLGLGSGYLLARAMRRGYIPEYLKPPVLLGWVLVVYSLANLVQAEAGLLAATIFGVVLANTQLPSIDELRRFKEYISVLLVSVVFLLLTADLDPAILQRLNWNSVVLIAAMIFLVRPLAVWLGTIRSGMDQRERLLTAWVAPRGIVAAAIAGAVAPRMVEQGYADAEMLLPLTFALILATVVAHGFTVSRLAQRLGLAATKRNGLLIVGASAWSVGLAKTLQEMGMPVRIADASWSRLKPARMVGIPVHFGEILSEASERALDLSDINTLLAATSNDAYNALVCSRFVHELGQNHVFQLPMHQANSDDPRGLGHAVRGNVAFSREAVYEELVRRYYQGWRFHKTKLTEEYPYEAYETRCTGEAMPVIAVSEEGQVRFNSPDAPLEPQPGDTVLCFHPPTQNEVSAPHEEPRQTPEQAEAAARTDSDEDGSISPEPR